MFKFILVVAFVVAIFLLATWGYGKYVIWDAQNPNDDASALNKILTSLTPTVRVGDIQSSLNFNEGHFIIDIRSEEEYDAGHIPGAIWIPEGKLYSHASEKIHQSNNKVFVYGNTSESGAVSARLLRHMGYTAFYLQEGMGAWQKAGFKTEKLNSMYF